MTSRLINIDKRAKWGRVPARFFYSSRPHGASRLHVSYSPWLWKGDVEGEEWVMLAPYNYMEL